MADKKKKKGITTITTTINKEIISTPTNEKTHIICILDSSGSMTSIMKDSIGGFNEFLKQQKALPDKATITVALFDDPHHYQLLYDNVDIKQAEELTSLVWFPRGMTSLYDALGKTINTDRAKIKSLGKEAPAKVLVCIVTDGEENASLEYKGEAGRERIKSLIKECESNDNWNFIYLACGQDAFQIGAQFGMSRGNTITYGATPQGVHHMSQTLNSASVSYRGMSANSNNFQKKSKSLIADNEPEDKNTTKDNLTGSITTTGIAGGNFTVSNNSGLNTAVLDPKDKK